MTILVRKHRSKRGNSGIPETNDEYGVMASIGGLMEKGVPPPYFYDELASICPVASLELTSDGFYAYRPFHEAVMGLSEKKLIRLARRPTGRGPRLVIYLPDQPPDPLADRMGEKLIQGYRDLEKCEGD